MTISINNLANNVLVNMLNQSSERTNNIAVKLASGLKINQSADNAAGLAIATGMSSELRGYTQGIQNGNDGMSLLQTADGSSSSITDLLQRQRELAVQSMNGTYNDSDRAAMNTEFSQLTNEISRIAGSTNFNGIPVLSNQSATGALQNGAPSPISINTGNGQLNINLANFSPEVTGGVFGSTPYTGVGVGTVADATAAIDRIDSAVGNITQVRSDWGATQNRLTYSVDNLANNNVNIRAARSQIQDTDYAREMVNMSREKTLQQAGIALLAQSKHNGQQVMALLGVK